LPNGENYREVLIQYEPKRQAPNYEIKELPEKVNGNSYGVYEGDKLVNTWFGRNNAEEWVQGQKANYKEYGNFESSHFDEPNILAHMRVTDRTIDGKKTLFVEEIQSDWHQAGRKKGYLTGDPKKELNDYESNLPTRAREAMKENALKDGLSEKEADDLSTSIVRNTDFDGMVKYLNETDKYKELFNKVINKDKLVPDAPFKKNWQELAMKRAMQMASEGGYERVAFTTGKQQADRYSLSKQISSIKYTDDGQLRAYGKNGEEVIARKLDSPDQLEDYIGKEAAKKLMEQEPQMIGIEGSMGTMRNTGRELSGVNLDVGGEGMKGFYDKILPDFINKYGKKHGLQVGQTKLPPNLNINSIVLNQTGLSRKEWDALSKAEKEQTLKEMGYGGNEGVHYFDLTPKLKNHSLKKDNHYLLFHPLWL
jgi:hypothetical protein